MTSTRLPHSHTRGCTARLRAASASVQRYAKHTQAGDSTACSLAQAAAHQLGTGHGARGTASAQRSARATHLWPLLALSSSKHGTATTTTTAAAASAAASFSSALSAKIAAAPTPQALKSLVLGSQAPLTPADLALIFDQLVALHDSSAPPTTARRLGERRKAAAFALRLLREQRGPLQGMESAGLAQVLRALARLHCRLDPPTLSDYLALSLKQLPHSSPRQLSSELRSLSQLLQRDPTLWQSPQLVLWLGRFREVSEPLLIRFGADELTITITAMCDLAATPYRPSRAWMLQYTQAVRAHLRSFQSHQLAKVLAAFARLQFKPDRVWAAEVQQQVRLKLALFDGSDLALLLCAVADGRGVKLLDDALAAAVAQELMGRRLHMLPPSPLARALYALAVMQVQVGAEQMEAVLGVLQPSLPKARPAVLSDIAWSLPRLGCSAPPATFLRALEAASMKKLSFFRHAQLEALITGMALLRWRPAWGWLEGVAAQALTACSALPHRAGVLHALAGLGCPATPAVLSLVADSVRRAEQGSELGKLTVVQQAQLLWGASRLAPSHLPHTWLRKWCTACQRQLGNLSPALWCDVLQALAWTSFRPDSEWLVMAAVSLQGSFREMEPWEMAGCTTGLAGIGYRVSRRWSLDLQAAAVKLLDSFSLDQRVQLGWGLAMMGQRLSPDMQRDWDERVVPALLQPPQQAAELGDRESAPTVSSQLDAGAAPGTSEPAGGCDTTPQAREQLSAPLESVPEHPTCTPSTGGPGHAVASTSKANTGQHTGQHAGQHAGQQGGQQGGQHAGQHAGQPTDRGGGTSSPTASFLEPGSSNAEQTKAGQGQQLQQQQQQLPGSQHPLQQQQHAGSEVVDQDGAVAAGAVLHEQWVPRLRELEEETVAMGAGGMLSEGGPVVEVGGSLSVSRWLLQQRCRQAMSMWQTIHPSSVA